MLQNELDEMARLMAESILEKDNKDNLYKFYIILVTIISLTIIAIIVIIFLYLSDIKSATNMCKAVPVKLIQNNKICFDTKNENILKVKYKNNVKWVYKTYHTDDELVYITTAK